MNKACSQMEKEDKRGKNRSRNLRIYPIAPVGPVSKLRLYWGGTPAVLGFVNCIPMNPCWLENQINKTIIRSLSLLSFCVQRCLALRSFEQNASRCRHLSVLNMPRSKTYQLSEPLRSTHFKPAVWVGGLWRRQLCNV